jgi:hypothetical protein
MPQSAPPPNLFTMSLISVSLSPVGTTKMALHLTKAEHDADPPEKWTVEKHGNKWALKNSHGHILDTESTKAKALALKTSGQIFNLYQDEGRWMNGEQVKNWKPYVEPIKPIED